MMNQQDIFKKIGIILTELNEQYHFLAQHPEKLNELEVELFLANANFLSDHVHIVKRLNAQLKELAAPEVTSTPEEVTPIELPQVSQTALEEQQEEAGSLAEVARAEEEEERVDVQAKVEIEEAEAIQETVAEDLLHQNFFKPDQDDHTFEFVLGTHSEDDKFEYEEKAVDEIFDRKLSAEEEEILARKKRIHEQPEADVTLQEEDEIGPEPFLMEHEIEPELNDKATEPIEQLQGIDLDDAVISPPVEERPVFVPEAVPVRPTVAETTGHTAPTLNDLLAKSNATADAPKPTLTDLKQGINLNEKLLFIKDLFGGYNLAYSEAIDLANKMNSFEAADTFLQKNYAVKNNWASKQGTVDQFYELLNRRFTK